MCIGGLTKSHASVFYCRWMLGNNSSTCFHRETSRCGILFSSPTLNSSAHCRHWYDLIHWVAWHKNQVSETGVKLSYLGSYNLEELVDKDTFEITTLVENYELIRWTAAEKDLQQWKFKMEFHIFSVMYLFI